ncbi:GNAT family N-acetyltransferase [Streptomyces sp. NPDC088354]|uniref:GNAT family N-acetyltransferase n=1 Tax=unclassified Streptomyces TaxID=2593676 RepID=UPI00299FD19E|nr:GNAT family N-acetyltransferase [Streptomyces sp. MI02-7b]MDX3078018.1 GNAT family N-acetyltransferase [Streptomyces sp. MI02-7b]
MTTTLRPAEPEQTWRGGVRARRYAICVNGRPVGETTLCTDARFGPGTGRIAALRIDHDQQRRGRGTVAALAAEEVLRDWGCRRIEVSVRSGETAAFRLARTLGYTERNRNMLKALPDAPPALPEGSEPRAMTEAEFPAWLARMQDEYVRSWTLRGVPEAQARAKAEADHRSALPGGLATPGTVLRVLRAGGEDVGDLWVGRRATDDGEPSGYVYNVQVEAAHRGRGHGRTLMLVAERACVADGLHWLGLNVFAGNDPALRLYESLGYRTTQVHFAKPLL